MMAFLVYEYIAITRKCGMENAVWTSGLWVAGFIVVHRPFRCYAATSGQSFTHNMPLCAEQ